MNRPGNRNQPLDEVDAFNMELYAEVALPLPLPQTFTYRCPPAYHSLLKIGTRVLVPFVNKKLTGYVVELKSKTELTKIRDIYDALDSEPLFDQHVLELCRWVSAYYLCSLGEAIRNALPPGLSVN